MSVDILDYSQSQFPYDGIQLTDQFKSELYPHQRQAVEWMLYREQIPHENVRGGLLLDEMGVGKTLEALATAVLGGGLSLTIVPAQLVYVWESEIKTHFRDIRYFVYHGSSRKRRFERYRLHGNDPTILIMSYHSVVGDIEDPDSPLRNMQFYRIIFDECHYIKNQFTAMFRAVSRVRSDIKWFLSGTPIMNRIHEISPYLKLLDYRGIRNLPRQERSNRCENVSKRKYIIIQDLLKNIAIRRTKDILDLPSKTSRDTFVHLDTKEREFYTTLTEYSKARAKKLMRNILRIQGSGLPAVEQSRYRVIVLQNILSLLFHLRLACCDPVLVIDKIPRTRDLDVATALKILDCRASTEKECSICCNHEANVINRRCGHKACQECWKRLSRMEPMRCFICWDETTLIDLETTESNEECISKQKTFRKCHDDRLFHRSSKTREILRMIDAELAKGNKVVVISQWTLYLDKIVEQFQRSRPEIRYVKMDGRTEPMKRQKLVDTFQSETPVRVCFASLGSSAEGVTLHAACSMIICDVYWNQAKLTQMSDRIHRIGQEQAVTIHCLYVQNSIEMKLKELIDKKELICKVVVDCAPVTRYVESWLTRIIKLLEN